MACSQILKEETKRLHAKTEAALVPKLKRIKNRQDLVNLLHLFYSFYSPVENKIFKHLSNNWLPGYKERIKSHVISACLRNLGDDSKLNFSPATPLINNCTQAFGALYVLEGSTMGGQIIARMLKANLPGDVSDDCLAFFTIYGDNTIPMWTSFKDNLDNRFTRKDDVTSVVNTANETFLKFENWILNYES